MQHDIMKPKYTPEQNDKLITIMQSRLSVEYWVPGDLMQHDIIKPKYTREQNDKLTKHYAKQIISRILGTTRL